MACGNSCNNHSDGNTGCSCGYNQGNSGSGYNYVCIIVLYILLAIILGSCFF